MYTCSQYSVVLPRTAAQVLMCPDGIFKTHTSLRHNINQAYLDFLIFVQRNKTSPGLMRSANRKPPEPPFAGELTIPQTTISRAFQKKQPLNRPHVIHGLLFFLRYTNDIQHFPICCFFVLQSFFCHHFGHKTKLSCNTLCTNIFYISKYFFHKSFICA